MSRNSLLDFYREIVNSEKSFGIDYKNLSKQLIERIDKAISYIYILKNNVKDFKTEYKEDILNMLDDIGNILGGEEQWHVKEEKAKEENK